MEDIHLFLAHAITLERDSARRYEELAEGQFDLMKSIKRMLDPNNIMNPGKYNLDEAYPGGES